MPARLATKTKPVSDTTWTADNRILTLSGPIWSLSRPMAKVAATAVSRISEIASEPRAQIAREVAEFITSVPNPQLWAWYAAYEHVALAQLFGRMIDLPDGIPM